MADYTHIAKPGEIHDHSGGTGAGGDTRAGETDQFRKGRSPDDRSTAPDAAATNHDHPSVPGTRTSIPGEGIGAEAGVAAGTAAPVAKSDGTPAAG